MSRGREIRNHFPDGPEQIKRDEELARGDPLKQSAWIYGHDVLEIELGLRRVVPQAVEAATRPQLVEKSNSSQP